MGDQGGGDSFVGNGFTNWKKKERFRIHEGGANINSLHRQAWRKCQDLLNKEQHIETIFSKLSDEAKKDYRVRLTASIDCIRYLLRQGLPFRGHDESKDSSNQGNFIELLKFVAEQNEDVRKVTLKNAPENLKLTSPEIQKDICNASAIETTNAIIKELGDGLFSILLDESRDVSTKEQMAIALRYVNNKGHVIERFLGIQHVTNTTALTLKKAIEDFFSTHKLSISRLRGQGYDGANMRGELNGLKTLILQENECAYYVHCFAHQLQLALVAVAKNHMYIANLFALVSNIVNVVGGSCKRRDILREKQAAKIMEALSNNDVGSGRGLNQESTLVRASDTRWGSHYGTLLSIITLFQAIIDVLDDIVQDGTTTEQRLEAFHILNEMQSFEFVFNIQLMRSILGITNDLSQALQRKDQDIVNAMKLVQVSKEQLQLMRDSGWNSLMEEVSSFCVKNQIVVSNMNDMYVPRGRSRRRVQEVINSHHYQVGIFYTVIDMQLQELNNHFDEVSTELLLCVACLNPSSSFASFDRAKLIQFSKFYSKDFSDIELLALSDQLENFVMDVRTSVDFSDLKGISDLAQNMVETKKDIGYPLVYRLLTLALILPVATATVERAFSAMKIVKNRLRNRMGDQWMHDTLVVYIEKDIFNSITNDAIIYRFQNMKNRRGQL
ncbi:uncharacterized protein LOC130789836 [Actinidia eriantha]|uniref:uncharacterized protein LOC130789836 n=1 Tax=Actinidia eriantha TaxID=165200 RepID=UPI0025848146|nr:uncharacterized protein LOC130789836 [Actinidia eriantha]